MNVLPKASYQLICNSNEAELIKYGGNNFLYLKVVYINILYDLAEKLGCNWEVIRNSLAADPRIGSTHLNPVHKSGELGGHIGLDSDLFNELHNKKEISNGEGRGAGGHCFIKDFAAFSQMYKNIIGDEAGMKVLESLKEKNIDLLKTSGKDLDLLAGVYGKDILKK